MLSALEAVNLMLISIGEQRVNSLDTSGIMEAEVAQASLQDASRDVQAHGWHFNTDKGVLLAPDAAGHINLPANCLRADTVGPDRRVDVVQRGLRLYDRRRRSFVFKDPVRLDMVTMLDFDELPEYARRYIAIIAQRRFVERVPASPVLDQFSQRDELMARVTMESADAENADYNIITDTPTPLRTVARRW